jgi:hypothetical protein
VNNSASLTTVVQEVKKRFADAPAANLGHRPKLSGNRAAMLKGRQAAWRSRAAC